MDSLLPPDFNIPGEIRYIEEYNSSKKYIPLSQSYRRTAPGSKTALGSNIWVLMARGASITKDNVYALLRIQCAEENLPKT